MTKWMVCAAVAAVAMAAMAGEKAEQKEGERAGGAAMFKKMDADGNGTVSLEEYVKARNPAGDEARMKCERVFKKMDANSDGQLTADEMREWMKSHAAKVKPESAPAQGGENKQ